MTTSPEQGLRLVVGSALCALATCASLLALRGLVDGDRWFRVACVAVLVVAATTALARAATRRWWVPTAIGTVVALVGLTLRYGAPPGRPQFLPDLDAVRRTWATAAQGVTVVNDSLVPMPDVRPAELLLVTAALAVLLLLDAAVLALRFPAVGGLPLLAPWLPGVVLGFPASGSAAFAAGTTYLAVLAFGAAPLHAQAGRLRRSATAVVAALGLTASTVVAAPALADMPGWARLGLPTFGEGATGPLELSDELDLRESLGSRSSQIVLRYRVTDPTALVDDAVDATEETDGPEETADADDPQATADPAAPPRVDARLVGPLRAFTVADFDGRSWERTESPDVEPWDPATLLASDPALRGSAPTSEAGSLALVDMEVEGLRERRLPVSTFPRTVVVDGQWGYDPARDEVVGERATGEGLTYSMLVQVPRLTRGELEGAPTGLPTDPAIYTAVPDTPHREDIAALTADVVADAGSPYAQAVAMQTWLRSTSNFTYDTRVAPARTADAVWDFLTDRRGYCVQFATAMAMMARTLDIPSRVGVGFLPGERAEDGSFVVTGRLAHAWPELYFEGHGWVRFEPTPASQAGPPPVWADPFSGLAAPTSGPEEPQGLGPGQVPSGASTAVTSTPSTQPEDDGSWVRTAALTGLALLLAAAAATAGLLTRRRRRRVTDPEEAWAALRRELGRAGVRWSEATTPRGAVREVRGAVVPVGDLDPPAREALENLARTVEQSRYAPAPVEHDGADLDAWVQEATRGVRDALARDAERPTADASTA